MEKSERTKHYIIEKAAAIFNMYGYAGTSISQLTKEIGMTKGAIYGNFKDKDEIALASFDYNFSKISKIITQVLYAK
jgi:TetR/AcrR family transcriptional regulator, transcriptional repressor for nem operon